MRTIALINQKGGVGKTTTAVNLGACLAKLGKSIVLIDLDPQGNSSSWLNVNIYDLNKSMFHVFHDGIPIREILHDTCVENMWIAPSNVTLAAIERTLANKLENDTILKKSISPLLDHYDYIILDCPPSLGLLTVNALSAVREVFIPLETKVLALNGLVTLVNTVTLVKDRLNPSLEVTGIIACMFDIRTSLSNKVVEKIRDKFHNKLFKSIIRESTQLAECPISGQPITLYAPDSRGTQDYMALAREVVAGEVAVEKHFVDFERKTEQNNNDDDPKEVEGVVGNEGMEKEEREEVERIGREGKYRFDIKEKSEEEAIAEKVEIKDETFAGKDSAAVEDEEIQSKEKGRRNDGESLDKGKTGGSSSNEKRNSVIDKLYNYGEEEQGENE